MDGNRRWAKVRSLPGFEGHRKGVEALQKLVSICPKYKIQYLTVYAFSTENWRRTESELTFLFGLLAQVAVSELDNLIANNVKLRYLGDLDAFQNSDFVDKLIQLENKTRDNTGLHLQIALNYGAISDLAKTFEKNKLNLPSSEDDLPDPSIPYPDLIIRTGGEMRLSNFLLWEAAHAELKFTTKFWPDFDERDLQEIIGVHGDTAKTAV